MESNSVREQGLPGVGQFHPVSTVHLLLQPSLETKFPSSQASVPSFRPSPQMARTRESKKTDQCKKKKTYWYKAFQD